MAYNHLIELLPSVARTATTNSGVRRNRGHRGVRVHIDCTADPAAASVTFTIQGADTVTGDYYTLLASAAVNATGDTYLLVYPGAAVSANVSANAVLPPFWRVLATHSNADSITYQVTAELLV